MAQAMVHPTRATLARTAPRTKATVARTASVAPVCRLATAKRAFAAPFTQSKRVEKLSHVSKAAGEASEGSVIPVDAAKEKLITLGFIALWYALNVGFNLTNKSIFMTFPFPWTVSAIHVVVGTIYCAGMYLAGAKKASFGRPITGSEWKAISGPALMHALGHIAANISFAAVAISLTHTVKTLEPVFNVVTSSIFLGTNTPIPIVASLLPIMLGVAMASAAELSFNWIGFITAMLSNLTFSMRAVWSKKAMADIKDLPSTALYAYTTLISMIVCVPMALAFEGPKLKAGADAAIASVGAVSFYTSLLSVGLLYHLYNQFAFNTLERVSPVSHGVCNVVKRVVIIGTSVLFFGNKLTTKTLVGTIIALAGTALYTELSTRQKMKKA